MRCCRRRWAGRTTTCTCSTSVACCTATSMTSRASSATRTPSRSATPPAWPASGATSTTSVTAGTTTSGWGSGWRRSAPALRHASTAAAPHCVAAPRACPPEDCGGPGGYEHLLEVLADPADAEHAELLEWVGGEFDPEAFDVASTNELLELYDRHTRQRARH